MVDLDDLKLAQISESAYDGPINVRDHGFDEVIEFNNERTGTEAYLAIHNASKVMVLVFCGTEDGDNRDVSTDLNYSKDAYRGFNVHSGFLDAYYSIATALEMDIAPRHATHTLYVTGHSLGGALACVYALYSPYRPHTMVTYGQPRVGGKKAARKLSGMDYRRYVNRADIVARIPIRGYVHGGVMCYMDSDNNRVINPTLRSIWGMLFFWKVIKDHYVSAYIKTIRKYNKNNKL